MINITFEDLKYWTLTVWGEARGEPFQGKKAVAFVILNRAIKRNQSIKDVCLAAQQFSCWNVNDPNYKLINNPKFNINTSSMVDIIEVIHEALGNANDPTKGSTHYCTVTTDPYWAIGKTPVITVGNHKFYNNVA